MTYVNENAEHTQEEIDPIVGTGVNARRLSTIDVDSINNQLAASAVYAVNYKLPSDLDWAPAINQAIQVANTNQVKKVICPSGILLLNSPILHNIAGWYAKLDGQGLRNTYFKANAIMNSMMIMSDFSGFHGKKVLEGFTFDCNFLATNGIDATYLRYSTIQNNEIINMAENGFAIITGNWVMRIKNNIIGCLNQAGTAPYSNGIQIVASAINNLIIRDNSISSPHVGVQGEGTPNDLHIVYNNFDSCDCAAIWLKLAGRNISIKHNYFENCGKGAGVSVQKGASTFETWNGTIILHGAYSVLYTYFFENLDIQENEFANCYTGSLITASGLSKVDIRNNHVLSGYNYTYFLNLKWVGCSYIFANRIFVEVNETAANQFVAPVGLNTDSNKLNTTGLVIRHYLNKDGSTQAPFYNGFELTTPENWNDSDAGAGFNSGAWTVNPNGVCQGVFPIRQLAATPNSKYKIIDLTLDQNKYLRGQYVRLNVLSKGDAANNSLWLYVYIDGVSVLDVYNTSNGTFVNATNSPLVYIPPTANKLMFRVKAVDGTNSVSYTKFNISLASKDPENLTYAMAQ